MALSNSDCYWAISLSFMKLPSLCVE